MFFKKRISKIIPQWSLHPLRFPQFWGTETFFTIKEGVFLPLRLSCKESSTFLTKPLFPQEREDVTALWCSEPLRYRVGGPIKGLAILCGMGPPGNNDTICLSLMLIYISLRKFQRSTSSSMVKMNFLALIFAIIFTSPSYQSFSLA